MKFLCVPCDTAMRLHTIAPPDRGSLSIVYSCPECGYEMAMLTNAYETQLVQSLGVRIGPEVTAGGSSTGISSAADQAGTDGSASGGRCPFAAMIPPIEEALDGAARATGAAAVGTEGAPAGVETSHGPAGDSIPVRWTSAAEARLANIPAFVRPMARLGIERFARENGAVEVDEKVLDAARDFFGM